MATDDGGATSAAIVELHERYLREVVEGLGLCPFARRCREQGRIARPIFDLRRDPAAATPEACARTIAGISAEIPAVEVILLTFLVPQAHPWRTPVGFESQVRELRAAYESLGAGPRYYMVPFHPAFTRAEPPRPLTQDSLVPLIRRTPDPVIQCIRAELLDGFRRQAQIAAETRFRAEIAKLGPELQALLAHAVLADPELSSEIARSNFEAIGEGAGFAEFERRITELLTLRSALEAETPEEASVGSEAPPTRSVQPPGR